MLFLAAFASPRSGEAHTRTFVVHFDTDHTLGPLTPQDPRIPPSAPGTLYVQLRGRLSSEGGQREGTQI